MKFFLAPMQGLTGYTVRNAFHHHFDYIDKYYTPFIPAAKRMNAKIKRDIDPVNNDGITLIPQAMSIVADEVIDLHRQLVPYGVIYDLKHTPFSRRILTNIYVHQDLHEMNLYPCAYSMTFNVTQKKGDDRLTLNGILNQRSQDVLAANNWNVCQYAVLMHMLAQVCDMRVGELVHVIADAHIYDRHVPIVKELIERPQYDAPKFWLNPDIKDFYQFTTDDIKITDYVTGEQIKDIPIAV